MADKIGLYPVQRQIFPSKLSSISWTVADGFEANKEYMLITMPKNIYINKRNKK